MQALARLLCLVACDVLVTLDVGAYGQVDYGLVGSHHADVAVAAAHLAALGIDGHATHKAHLTLQALVLGRHTEQRSL